MTEVFVVEDLAFVGVTRGALDAVNPRLVGLIATIVPASAAALRPSASCSSCARFMRRPDALS